MAEAASPIPGLLSCVLLKGVAVFVIMFEVALEGVLAETRGQPGMFIDEVRWRLQEQASPHRESCCDELTHDKAGDAARLVPVGSHNVVETSTIDCIFWGLD